MPNIVPIREFVSELDSPKMRAQLLNALPQGRKDLDRLKRIVITLLRTKTDLTKCTKESFFAAVMECFQLGLEPGLLSHAYFVPFGSHCQLIPGYRGMMELARRSGDITKFHAAVVREGDQFSYSYTPEKFGYVHEPKLNNQGNVVAAYAVAWLKNGSYQFRVAEMRDIQRAEKASASGKKGPWASDYEAMCCKTAIRRLAPWLPQCPELQRAVVLEDQHEAGLPQEFSHSFEEAEYAEVPTQVETVRAKVQKAKAELSDAKPKPKTGHGGQSNMGKWADEPMPEPEPEPIPEPDPEPEPEGFPPEDDGPQETAHVVSVDMMQVKSLAVGQMFRISGICSIQRTGTKKNTPWVQMFQGPYMNTFIVSDPPEWARANAHCTVSLAEIGPDGPYIHEWDECT